VATFDELLAELRDAIVLWSTPFADDFDNDGNALPDVHPMDVVERIVALGPAVVPSLLAHLDDKDAKWLTLALWKLDRARAIALDLHRGPHWRTIHDHLKDPATIAMHLALVLEDPEHPIVREVLHANASSTFSSPLANLISIDPQLVPIDLLRVVARGRDEAARAIGVRLLAQLHHAEDAEYVLAQLIAQGEGLHFERTHYVHWLAPLPESDQLLPLLERKSLFELARRRRCAGLPNDAVSDFVHALPSRDEWADRVLEELGEAPGPPRPTWITLARADGLYAAGHLDDERAVDDTAYAAYAYVLRTNPSNVRAALQLARIDRAYGTPITPERIAWLRSLGADPPTLDELVIPVAPIPGIRRMA
jgi:hypothetical protein